MYSPTLSSDLVRPTERQSAVSETSVNSGSYLSSGRSIQPGSYQGSADPLLNGSSASLRSIPRHSPLQGLIPVVLSPCVSNVPGVTWCRGGTERNERI